MAKPKRNPFATVIERAKTLPPCLLRPDNDAGRKDAEAEFRARYGKRFTGLYVQNHLRSDPTQAFFAPRLRAAKRAV